MMTPILSKDEIAALKRGDSKVLVEAFCDSHEALRAVMLEAYELIKEGEIYEATALLKINGDGDGGNSI